MSKQEKKQSEKYLWVALPLLSVLVTVVILWFVHIPVGIYAINQGKHLAGNYQIKKDATRFPSQLKRIKKEQAILDSVLKEVDEGRDTAEQRIPDQLYVWADATGFINETVEAGTPQNIAGHQETAVSITGSGGYSSIGKFIANIENSSQSTRIRQLQIKRGEEKALDVFIDFVVREENGKTP